MRVRLADGRIVLSREAASFPVRIRDRQRWVVVRRLTQLSEPCILGLDCLKEFKICIDFSIPGWSFRDTPRDQYPFSLSTPQPANLNIGDGLAEGSMIQDARLRGLLDREIPPAPPKLTQTHLVEHHIDVGGHPPIRQRFRAVPPPVYQYICGEVDRMLAENIIEPSTSAWSNPIVLAKHPSGKRRFCLDFWAVIKVTKKDAYPIPLMDRILDRLRDARYISTIDLKQAYHQIPLLQASRDVTAFPVSGKGFYQYRVMPFGLTNAPATFQRFVDRLFGPEFEGQVFKYLDDIIVGSQDFETHLDYLQRVLRKLREAKLTINRDKCEFMRSQVPYLGLILDRSGLHLNPEKVKPILELSIPRSLKQVRRLLGMVAWYRRFVPDLAAVVEPITWLTRKKQRLVWGPEQAGAFAEIKRILTTRPVLGCPNFELPFVLQCHASTVGLGAILSQIDGDKEMVVVYGSRTLSEPERRYSETERECLAVIWATQKFRPYLEGTEYRVYTDAPSLRWLLNQKHSSGRLGRWIVALQDKNFTILNRNGTSNCLPEALARTPDDDNVLEALQASVEESTDDFHDPSDSWYAKRLHMTTTEPHKHPDWRITDGRLYYHQSRSLANDLLSDREAWKLVVPRKWRYTVIRECHDTAQAGHLGTTKTCFRVSQSYFWPNIFRDVARFIKHCVTCQKHKVGQTAPAGLMRDRAVTEPWEVVAADIVGPLPRSKSGNEYLLVMQDLFTKWIEVKPLRRATGPKIAEALDDLIINRWGTPDAILTDNGTEFVNVSLKELAQGRNITLQTTPVYCPRANPSERVNRVLKTMLSCFVGSDHRGWDTHLADFRFAYNTAYHEALQATPAFLNLGRELKARNGLRRRVESRATGSSLCEPPENWQARMENVAGLRRLNALNLGAAREKQKHYYNLRHRPAEFEVGQLVLMRNYPLSPAAKKFAAKLAEKFSGPCRVELRPSHAVYVVRNLNTNKTHRVSVTQLKPYYDPAELTG